MNCHGCKWLDRYKTNGNGYCVRVCSSKTYRGQYIENGKLIADELEDACTYAKLALEYKETEPEVAQLFNKLSQEEMEHMEALHKREVAYIDRYRQKNGEPPAGMKALYDFLHKREIEKAEKIAALQSLYKR